MEIAFPSLGGQTLALAAVFVCVMVAVLAAAALFGADGEMRRRLAAAVGGAPAAGGRTGRAVLRTPHGRWTALLDRLDGVTMPDRKEEVSGMRLRLMQAGFLSPDAVRVYYAVRIGLGLLLPALFLANVPFLLRTMDVSTVTFYACVLMAAGLYLPTLWLRIRIGTRQQAVSNAFPDALDMLVVCVEAGLGIDQAFGRVGTQMVQAHPLLGEQLALVSLELRAGRTRAEALRGLADRTGVPEIRSFVTLLIQSETLGTSIARTLRVQADEMRNKRMMRAEEKAHKLPVMLSVPLVACILPTMIAVLMLPGVIRVVRDVIPNMVR